MRSLLEAALAGPRPAQVAGNPPAVPGTEVARPVNRHSIRDTRTGQYAKRRVNERTIRIRGGKVVR